MILLYVYVHALQLCVTKTVRMACVVLQTSVSVSEDGLGCMLRR